MVKKRVLNIVPTLEVGSGVMSTIMNYYKNIDTSRIQFDFIYFVDRDITYIEEIKQLGGNIYKVNVPNLKNTLRYRSYLKSVIKKHELHHPLIHFHAPILVPIIAPVFKEITGAKIITHSHSVAYSYHPIKKIRNYIMSLSINKNTDYFFSCSRKAAEFWFGEKVVIKEEVRIINNAIDCEKFKFNRENRDRTRKNLEIGDDITLLGHVGRFSKEKNHRFLINVFHKLIQRDKKYRLLLIGEGNKKKEIKQLVNQLNLNNYVVFIKQKENIEAYYHALDLFIFPSISEGLGLAAIEAQAAGITCIASDTVPEEADMDNIKFLSLNKEIDTWVNEIRKTHKFKPNAVESLRTKGYCINTESLKLVQEYERLFREIEQF